MSRPIEQRLRSAHPAAAVFAALTDESYLRARLDRMGGKDSKLTGYAVDGGTTRYTLHQTVEAQYLPSAARAVIPGNLVIERTERWSADGNGVYLGATEASVPGMPGSVRGTTRLSGQDGSELVFTGSVMVSLPLVGGKLESLIVDQLGRLLRAEATFTERWLSTG